MLKSFVPLSALVGTTLLCSTQASTHDWYPMECCHHDDCAPVESVERLVPTGGAPRNSFAHEAWHDAHPRKLLRESKDGRMHICVRANDYGRDDVMCLFMPPSM